MADDQIQVKDDVTGDTHVFPAGTDPTVIKGVLNRNRLAYNQGISKPINLQQGIQKFESPNAAMRAPQQQMEAADKAAQDAQARMQGLGGSILPGIGMVAGGMVGNIPGAGLGAAAGEVGNQLLGVTPPDTGNVLKEGFTGAAGEGLGRLVPALGSRALNPAWEAFQRTGIPATMGDVGGPMVRGVQDLMSRTFLGSGPIEKARDKQIAAQLAAKTGLLDAIGPAATAKEYGQSAQKALQSNYTALYGDPASGVPGNFDRAYSELRRLIGDTPVPQKSVERISAAAQGVNGELNRLEGLLETQQPGVTNALRQVVSQLSNLGGSGQWYERTGYGPVGKQIDATAKNLGYANAKDAMEKSAGNFSQWVPKDLIAKLDAETPQLQNFDQIRALQNDLALRIDAVPNTAAGKQVGRYLNILKSAVDQAAQTTADHASPLAGQTFSDLQKAYGDAAQIYRSKDSAVAAARQAREPEFVLSSIFGKGAATEPENFHKAITGDVFSNPSAAAKLGLTQSLGPTQQATEATSRQLLNSIFQDASSYMKGSQAGEVKTFGSKIRESLDAIPPEVQKRYFTPQQLSAIKDFADVSARIEPEVSEAGGKGSWIKLSQAGLILGGAAFGHPGTATTVLVAPPILSRIMTNPTATKFMARGFELTPGTAAASQWLSRAAALAKIYRDHDVVPEKVVYATIAPDESLLH